MESLREQPEVVWSGEHWLLYLRGEGEETDCASISLYVTRYSPAGSGTAALVQIPGPGGFPPALCTDDPDLAELIKRRVVNWDVSPFDPGLPVVAATFARSGDVRHSPSWRIETGQRLVETTWSDLEPAILLEQPMSSINGTTVTHMALFFAGGASVSIDGRSVDGAPYTREKWRRATGRPRGSCCFSISETMVEGF